jgi:DNA polymerase-3 subunit gamma/tau
MLTGAAFNALLKTLEEPPAHTVFVLATTEYEKLPPTITSRTQRFLFRKLSKVQILEKLGEIVAAEKIKIESTALELVAAAAEGSLRDAESILDQASSAGEALDLKAVEEMTGRTGLRRVDRLAEMILKKESNKALEEITKISEEGHNIVQFTRDLIHYLRKILTLKLAPETESSLAVELTGEEITRIKKLGEFAEPAHTTKLIRSLIRAYAEIRYSPFHSVPLEIALIENLSNPS